MKTLVFKPVLTVTFLIIALTACEKERSEVPVPEKADEGVLSVEALVNQANSSYLSGDVRVADEDGSFLLENDGLIDEYLADEEGFSGSRPYRNLFLQCLISVEPDREQRQQAARALQAYSGRNERIIKMHRQSMQTLRQRAEYARRQLHQSFENGDIDREQYRRQMLMLRKRYQEAVHKIRTGNAEAFSRSYALLLRHIKSVLSEEQWEEFAGCLKS